MDSHPDRDRRALPDAQRRVAGRCRRRGEPHRARTRRPQAERPRCDRGRHGFLRVCVPIVRVLAPDRARRGSDSRLRCRRGVFGIRLCALGRGFLDSCGRLSARAGSRHRCALDHGRLERSAHLRAVRRRRRRRDAGRGTRATWHSRQPAALLGQILGSPFGARDRARVHRSIPRFIATPTMRSR